MILGNAALVAAALAASLTTPAHGAQVVSEEYTLGDRALRVEGFRDTTLTRLQDIELAAVVHHPKRLRGGHPLVVLSHGLWETCADADGTPQQKNMWPCEPGTPALPSYRGYDYLGRELAKQGFVVVSVSANGANAGESGEPQDKARAMLVNKHLEMWRDLARGAGPLAGKLRTDFTGKVDLTRVGTMGHSRGGRGAVWQASDNHAHLVPEGVRVRAVVPLAPATYYAPDPEAPQNLDYRITRIPFGALAGTCDLSVVGGGPDYFENAAPYNTVPIHLFAVTGANHNFYNTQWSPSSGQVFAHDDATHPAPGQCQTADGDAHQQLSEAQQRRVAATYLSAFYRRYLLDDTSADELLTTSRPGVDARVDRP